MSGWNHISLGEERVVAKLIQNRSLLDPNAREAASSSFEEILCTYIDLDKLIDACG